MSRADISWQQAAQDHRVRPANLFVEFKKEEIEQSIPDRFEKQVREYPDRVAVETKKHEFTYAALNQMANHVARAILAQRGSGEEPISLLLENDAPMIAAILGVLKAGKIYVPLDPALPHARIAYILKDSQADLIVTDNKYLSFAGELAGDTFQLINIDKLDSGLSPENVGLPIPPDTPTWILYTSGSTGRPKGVVQTHRNALHYVMNYTNGFHISADDRLTLLYSCSASAATHNILSALLNGASLYPLDIKREGLTGLADWLIQQKITIYNSVPTVFRYFLDTLTGREQFPNLRLLIMMGEPVYRRDVELYKEHFSPNCIFVNRLGSTETGSIRWYFVDKETPITSSNVPVGHSVQDNEILLLDDAGDPIGLDQIGEIAVNSRYLSPGYWQRPDLTRAAFLPDPEGGDERIYRMGDLGRMLPDGCLVCLGRKDFQVKFKGYRIEPAEIEMALLDLDTIRQAAVIAREDRPGDQRLVAYLVPTAGRQAPTVTTLRHALAKILPEYMIPSTFVFLDALPLSPNGKVLRRALPAPEYVRPELANVFVAPRTPTEKTLTAIWAEVLALDHVGIYDNFFELGGHSLLATQIISRVVKAFEIKVSLQSLFQSPNVAEMAVVIAQAQAEKADREDVERMLAELEIISDEEARQRLADEKDQRTQL
jgi:amino acid adenylation domain-containing protein